MAKNDSNRGFADRVVSDPANPPELAVLSGYPGASSLERHLRLYLTLDLSEYIDVPESAVVHQEAVGEAPLQSVVMWIRRNAEVTSSGRGRSDVKARFFSGDIQATYATATLGDALRPQFTRYTLAGCPSLLQCPSQLVICNSAVCPLPTRNARCVTLRCPQSWLGCPTDFVCTITDFPGDFGDPFGGLAQQAGGFAGYAAPPQTAQAFAAGPQLGDVHTHASYLNVCVTRIVECQSQFRCPPQSFLSACLTQTSPLCDPPTLHPPCYHTAQPFCLTRYHACPPPTLTRLPPCPVPSFSRPLCPSQVAICPDTRVCEIGPPY